MERRFTSSRKSSSARNARAPAGSSPPPRLVADDRLSAAARTCPQICQVPRPSPSVQGPLASIACVQLLSDRVYIVCTTRCDHNPWMRTTCGRRGGSGGRSPRLCLLAALQLAKRFPAHLPWHSLRLARSLNALTIERSNALTVNIAKRGDGGGASARSETPSASSRPRGRGETGPGVSMPLNRPLRVPGEGKLRRRSRQEPL